MRSLIADSAMRRRFAQMVSTLPVFPLTLFQYYVLMLHYCITGKRLGYSDIHYQDESSKAEGHSESTPNDRHQVYLTEQQLFHHLREGDLNYQNTLRKAASLSQGIRIKTDNPLKQMLISTTSFTSLCTRVAIEGGLPPDTAYSVGDAYIQSMVASRNITEIAALNHAMYEDFVQRVHKIRMNNRYSRPILECCEYIKLHCEEKLSISLLAKLTNYSDYYLSRKFKNEVGMSIGDYIDDARVEKAKMLLKTTELPIAQIASSLQYCSSTHFSKTFQRVTGMLPHQYRMGEKKVQK